MGVFNGLDVRGVGYLTLGDLQAGLMKSGVDSSILVKPEGGSLELAQLFNGMDVTGNGQVSYTEFMAAALDDEYYSQESVLREVFHTLDTNRDGEISEGELNVVLGNVSDSDASIALSMRRRMAEAGLGDGTGSIELDFKVFAAMMKDKGKMSKPSQLPDQAGSTTSTMELLPNETSTLSSDFTDDFDDCAGDSSAKSMAWAKRVAAEAPMSREIGISLSDVTFEVDGAVTQIKDK